MNTGKLKVIFCTDGIFPHAIGGMQRHSRLLIEELSGDNDIQLIVVHPHYGKKVFEGNPAIEEIELDQGKSSGRYLVDCYNYSRQVFRILQTYPDAIVYAQGLSVWHKIRTIGYRVIVNPHGLEPYQTLTLKDKLTGAPFRMIFGYLFKRAAVVVSLGGRLTGILEKLLGSQKRKIIVLPNAVNLPGKYVRLPAGPVIRFLFVGRFASNKGIGILLEAMKQLSEQGYSSNFEANLVGKGPLFDSFKDKYAASNINFLGFADDEKLVELYKSNDVFVLPTLFEGMPTVVLEAMSYRMPVIVTDVGATCELVDEKNGFIIKKNDVKSLKEAMLAYSQMPDTVKKSLSDASYERVKNNFTWPVVAALHKQVFYQLRNAVEKQSAPIPERQLNPLDNGTLKSL